MKMSRVTQGVLVAVMHVAIVSSLFGKLMYDRATRPHVWVKSAPYDPELPIRGRYLSLRLELEGHGFKPRETSNAPNRYANLYGQAHLRLEGDKLVAESAGENDYVNTHSVFLAGSDATHVRLNEPVLLFIPEHAQDPSHRPAGEELWVEVTVPKKGPPRPIRLGVKKNGGQIEPLEIK